MTSQWNYLHFFFLRISMVYCDNILQSLYSSSVLETMTVLLLIYSNSFSNLLFLFNKSLDEQNLYKIIRPRSFIFRKCHIETFIAVLYNLSK